MKLNRIKIVNFRNHSSTDLDMSKKVNFFIGPNAAGKSSIVDALAFLFTGTNSRTAKSGEGMDEVVTFGESRALVAADIGGLGKVTRTIPHSFQVGDWEGTMSAQTDKMYQQLGFTKDGILCSIYSTNFLDMNPNEQKDFMFSLMGLKLKNDVVEREFAEWCQANNVEKPEDYWKYITKDFEFTGSASKFDEIYDSYMTARRLLKKEIKQLEVLASNIGSKLPEGVTIEHRDSVLSKLSELKAQRDKLNYSMGEVKSRENLIEKYKQIISKESTIEQIKENQEYIRTTMDQLKVELTKIQKKINKAESRVEELNSTTRKLATFDGKCPLSCEIGCKMSKEDIDAITAKFNSERDGLVKVMSTDTEEYNRLKTKADQLVNMLEKRVKADSLLPEIERAKKELQELQKVEQTDINGIMEQLRVLDERMTKGQSILTAIEAEMSNEKRRIEAKRNLESKQNEIKMVDSLVEAFGPKGLKSTILNKAMKPIEKKANERLRVLSNGRYQIQFRVDEEDFNIYVISENIERKVKHLSSSEKLRIGVIMQDAINSLIGSKFLVIDDVDILDKENRILFMELINSIKPNYDSIVILATGTEVKQQASDDINMFLIGKKVKNEIF